MQIFLYFGVIPKWRRNADIPEFMKELHWTGLVFLNKRAIELSQGRVRKFWITRWLGGPILKSCALTSYLIWASIESSICQGKKFTLFYYFEVSGLNPDQAWKRRRFSISPQEVPFLVGKNGAEKACKSAGRVGTKWNSKVPFLVKQKFCRCR